MVVNIEEVLKTLGWEDGFKIPVANAENQALEEELARLTLQKLKSKNAYDNLIAKLEGLKNHMKYVRQESDLTQRMIHVHKQQYESEENQYNTIKAQRDGVEQEIKQIRKSKEEAAGRLNVRRQELQRGNAKLDKLKTEIDWDKEALKGWEETIEKRFDDNETIRKYVKEDDKRFTELEAKRQIYQMEYVQRRETVEKMVSDITSYERVTERTGKTLKQHINEREALTKHWKHAVNILHQRDRNIETYEKQIINAYEAVQKQEETLEEQKQFLESQKNNNTQIMMEIEDMNAYNSRVRRDYQDMRQYVLTLHSEMEAMKRMVASTASHLETERIKGKRIVEDLNEKTVKIEKFKQNIEKLEIKIVEINDAAFTSKERIKYLESLLSHEEKLVKNLQLEHERMQTVLFRSRRQLYDQQEMMKLKQAEINSAHIAINQLTKSNKDTLAGLQRTKEVIYDLNLRIDQLESKIYKLERCVIDDEAMELDNKAQGLEKIQEEHNQVKSLLQDQIRKIEQDMGKLSLLLTQDEEQLTCLRDKLQNERMLYEGSQKMVAAAKLRSQEKQVEENMLRLRVNQFNKAMKKEEENIYTLKKFRITLDQLMRQRQIEIHTNKDILVAKRRHLDEDRGRLKADIVCKHLKIDQLQKKYHSALMLLGKDEEGQPLTVTHFKLLSSQEKYFLQVEGDELDAKVQKAEKEIIAMENTLKIVNLTNKKFRQSLELVEEDSEEVSEMKSFEKQLLEHQDTLKKLNDELEAKKKEAEELKEQIHTEMEQKAEKAANYLEECEERLVNIRKKDELNAEKIQRADCNIRKLLKKMKDKSLEKYERDMEIRQLQDANKSVIARLLQSYRNYAEMAPNISRYTSEYNITLPHKKPMSITSSSSSVMSRNSSCNSQRSKSSSSNEPASTASSKLSTVVVEFNP